MLKQNVSLALQVSRKTSLFSIGTVWGRFLGDSLLVYFYITLQHTNINHVQ